MQPATPDVKAKSRKDKDPIPERPVSVPEPDTEVKKRRSKYMTDQTFAS